MAEMNKRADFEDLVLVKATKEQWHRTHDHQVTEWGGGLSTEDFRRREETLCIESEFGKKGSFTGWYVYQYHDLATCATSMTVIDFARRTKRAGPDLAEHHFCSLCMNHNNTGSSYRRMIRQLLTLLAHVNIIFAQYT